MELLFCFVRCMICYCSAAFFSLISQWGASQSSILSRGLRQGDRGTARGNRAKGQGRGGGYGGGKAYIAGGSVRAEGASHSD